MSKERDIFLNYLTNINIKNSINPTLTPALSALTSSRSGLLAAGVPDSAVSQPPRTNGATKGRAREGSAFCFIVLSNHLH
jgi:hypothetical protein